MLKPVSIHRATHHTRKFLGVCLVSLLVLIFSGLKTAEAATYYWVTWNTYNFDGTTYTLTGTITTSGSTVTVTYTNTQGLSGYQLNGGSGGSTNYYSGGTDGASGTSPYTSATVSNRPNNVTIIRLSNAGAQTLTFSQPIANLAMAFVSLNGTAFSFDRNFDILSFGDSSDGGNACGYWGCGTATKASGSGSYPYVVSGTGEPHGTLHFPGSFSALTWTSGNENWHGFTVGIAGTASEVTSDTTPPTVTISPANGTTNVALASNVTITFNEEIRNLNDTPVTNSNVGSLITLKTDNASGTNIPFTATINSANTVITIDPTSNFSLDQVIYVSIGATVEDTFGNAISATNATFTTGASLPASSTFTDPRTKQDVVGNIEAWSNMAQRWAKLNLGAISYRFDWLRRNKDLFDKSHQGANISTTNPVANKLIKAVSGDKRPLALADAANFTQKYFFDKDQAISDAGSMLTDAALSQWLSPKQRITDSASAEDKPHWSWWTQGDILIGKVNGNSSTSPQRANDLQVFFGMDKPIREKHLLGFVAGLGKSNTDVGSSGSGVESDNYSLATYSIIKLPNAYTLETGLGYGHMQMDIVRLDSSQTLNGRRNADQLFGSIALHAKPLLYGKFSTTPYGRIEGTYTKLNGFSESGGTMALTFDKQTLATTMLFIGMDVEYAANIGSGRLKPFGKLEYGKNINRNSDVNMRYVVDTTDYRLTLASQASSIWRAVLGFDYQLKNGTSVSFAYSREEMSSGYLNGLKLKADVPF